MVRKFYKILLDSGCGILIDLSAKNLPVCIK
jgi:hypothetical protein